MHAPLRPSSLWVTWLTVVSAGVVLFGLSLVMLPDAARRGFSLLVYSDAGHISSFGDEAARYVALAHAVLGSVMTGWGVALILVVRGQFARGSRFGWQMISGSVLAWFLPDTAFSLWSGFWQNAVLNVLFFVLFLAPLAATYRICREEAPERSNPEP
jgi:uncharacterized membrane protein YqaE (UPF0057 family)